MEVSASIGSTVLELRKLCPELLASEDQKNRMTPGREINVINTG